MIVGGDLAFRRRFDHKKTQDRILVAGSIEPSEDPFGSQVGR